MNVVEPFAMIALLVLAGCGDQEHSSRAEVRQTGSGDSPGHGARGDAGAAPRTADVDRRSDMKRGLIAALVLAAALPG